MQLAGKTAIITGASRGIGAAIAKHYAAEGANVVINYNANAAKAEQVVAQIKQSGGSAIASKADVTSQQEMEQLCQRCLAHFEALDIFVNNAGWANLQPLAEIDHESLDRQVQTNVMGLIYGTQAAAATMGSKGRIINISSIAAKGGAGGSVYAATKAAANCLTKCYAAELGPRGITVNAIAPAAVETDLYYEVGLDQNRDASLAMTPLGTEGSVDDVAGAAVFFASEASKWITGEILQVSGGKAM